MLDRLAAEGPLWGRLLHHRTVLAALPASLLILVLPDAMTVGSRVAVGWIAYIAFQLVIVFLTLGKRGSEELRAWAPAADLRAAVFAGFLTASAVVSVMASVLVLRAAEGQPEVWRLVHLLLGAGTVLLTWFAVQTAFAVRYAALYYGLPGQRGEKGLDFPDDTDPDYWDFLYFATCTGMTFEVSDVRVRRRRFRRWITFHAVFSFVFASVNLALLVDIAASLI